MSLKQDIKDLTTIAKNVQAEYIFSVHTDTDSAEKMKKSLVVPAKLRNIQLAILIIPTEKVNG